MKTPLLNSVFRIVLDRACVWCHHSRPWRVCLVMQSCSIIAFATHKLSTSFTDSLFFSFQITSNNDMPISHIKAKDSGKEFMNIPVHTLT